MSDRHQVIIVGGGAGGLELATRLGDRLGRKGRAAVTLVDRNETHLWKPLLHEVAAGSMDIHAHQLDYLAQARWHHFSFRCGAFEGRSEEHTSELQSLTNLVCRLLLEKKKQKKETATPVTTTPATAPLYHLLPQQ